MRCSASHKKPFVIEGLSAATWLPLLRALTDEAATWLSWKNVEAALGGRGDIDSVASTHDWPRIKQTFSEWCTQAGRDHVFCNHLPGSLIAVALDTPSRRVLELHVVARQTFRGAPLFEAEDLSPVAVTDPRGFRRLRPGAEGTLLLALNGLKFLGRRNSDGLAAKGVISLLQSDPEGIGQTCELFGKGSVWLHRLATTAGQEEWSPVDAVCFDLWRSLRTLRSLSSARERLLFRTVALHECPVLQLTTGGRRFPNDPDAWLARVADRHEVIIVD